MIIIKTTHHHHNELSMKENRIKIMIKHSK